MTCSFCHEGQEYCSYCVERSEFRYPLYQVQITTKKNCYTFEVGEVDDYFATAEEIAREFIKMNEEPSLEYYTVNAKCNIGRTKLPGVNSITKSF